MSANVAYQKTIKTSKVDGKDGVVCSMSMTSHVELPYPDCKVTEKLCIGGPCFYLIDNSFVKSTAMNTFILTKVVANHICRHFLIRHV
jgi:hypothetical protein